MPLFIGGVRDGEWHAVDPHRDQWTLAARPRVMLAPVTEPVVNLTIRTSDYYRMKWRGLKETFEFFAVRGMSPDDAMERLLQNYRPAESEEASR